MDRASAPFPARRVGSSTARLGLLLLLGICPAARAWDEATHVSIVRGACRLSPSAESRIRSDHRDAFFEAVAKADQIDPDCRAHRGPNARREAAREAERALAELTAGPLSRYDRARTFGRFLHYVADCSVPTPMAEGKYAMLPDFFSNKDFLIFRERQDLGAPLAVSLRQRGGEAQWGEESTGAHAAILRLAINLTIDAMLLLPQTGGAGVPADPPLVIFLVNRVDNGAFTRDSRLRVPWWNPDYSAPNIRSDLGGRAAVEVVEWRKRRSEGKAVARALLFNGTSGCATKIVLKTRSWLIPAPQIEMTPQTLRAVELETPPDVELEHLSASWTAGRCSTGGVFPSAIPTADRLMLEANGHPPQFEGAVSHVVPSKLVTPLPLGSRRDRNAH